MKNEKKIFILATIMCAALVVLAYLRLVSNNNVTEDSIKFKEEYEELNGKDATLGRKYKELEIDESNPIKYSNYDEIIDIIKNKTGIIYLGFPECPWCRTALPVLFDVAKENKIDTIYYLNIKNERDSYIVEDGKLTYALDENGKEIKGTDGYFKLLDALKEHLSDYVINIDGESYEVGEKRLYAPSVIFVKEGKVLGIQVSTVESQSDGYEPLTKEAYEELHSIYDDYVAEMKSTTCSTDSAC